MNSEMELHHKAIWFGRNITKMFDESYDSELNLPKYLTEVDVPIRRLLYQASNCTIDDYCKAINNVFAIYPKK